MERVLEFTSIGNAIISELLKISEIIPDEFKISEKSKKFSEVIMDFQYFKLMDKIDKKIESDGNLLELDEFIRDNYSRILVRFYLAFESIFEYANNLNSLINDLNEGEVIQESLETIFQDPEGCQLICESLYLYAVMLIVLDIHIPGPIRERLLVAYYRYHSENFDSSIDDICKFCRSTSYNPPNLAHTSIVHFQPHTAGKGYPENFFSRVQLDKTFVSMVIETLKTEDIYHQMQKFPAAEHRTIALASQSAMLFACLYFQTDTLMNQNSRMREICDKFFYNNWIISLYMGLTVNLLDAWDGYKAAKSALVNILQPQMIREITTDNELMMKKMIESTGGLLKEGVMNESFLMKNLPKIIKIVRECNFCVRWWILNSSEIYTKKSKPFHDLLKEVGNFKEEKLYELILNISQLELCIRDIVKDLLENRESKWTNYKTEVNERLQGLILLFSGEMTVIKIEKNDHLKAWFEEIIKEIATLDLQQKPRAVEKKLIQLMQAVAEVQEYHNIQSNALAKQRLDEVLSLLSNMIHLLNIKDSILVDLQAIGDFSYAWYLIDEFTVIMQKSLQEHPSILIRLRALFIKMSSALEIPLLRINQCGGAEELVSITRYYSNELVKYVRKIVQIIPHSIFNLLKSIIELQTNHLKELPERLEKDKVREFAQLDERFKIAKLTFNISVFTDGILAMKKTLVGVIELDPKQLLEDGIRMELINSVSLAFNENLQFIGKSKNPKDLLVVENLTKLSKIIDGYRRSFEYIQDYLNINGLKIWQEEVMRLINFNVEQECNSFMRRKIQFSRYQSDAIPIPIHPPLQGDSSINFIGRLGREMLRITEPKSTIYVDLLTSWFDVKSHQEIVNQKFTAKINESIEIYGLVGLDKLYSFMISDHLEKIHRQLLKETMKEKQWIEFFQKFSNDLGVRKTSNRDNNLKPENPYKNYQIFINKCSKLLPNIYQFIMCLGQKQIWRNHIAHELTTTSRLNCRNLSDSIAAFNDALLLELRAFELDNNKPRPNSQILLDLNKYLEVTGQYKPIEKVYVKMGKNSNEFLTYLVIFCLTHLNHLAFGKNLLKYNKTSGHYSAAAVTKQRKILLDLINSSRYIDGHVFALGLITLMKQFHENNYLQDFIELFGSCVLEMMEFNLSTKNELNLEILNGIDLLETIINVTGISRIILEEIIPPELLDQSDYILSFNSI
ncbi:CLUMA_CG015404, isoform A [Clunio marinus]|uniref:CLUMA_CG015404, isoform A n=1 Tax=Clunio marinus TaxID=568069 RepID=A0A1J1IQY8_9DIPT|nr:CLUMA_CG015404, isoform A [Clunio marinus]